MPLLFSKGLLYDQLFGKELFIRFTASVFHEHLSICLFLLSLPLCCEGRMWDLNVLIPNHCLSFYLSVVLLTP